MTDSSKTGASSQHQLSTGKPATKRQTLEQELKEEFAQLTPEERKRVLLLMKLMTDTDSFISDNAVFVVYYDNNSVYQGSSVHDAMRAYRPLLSEVVKDFRKKLEILKELAFFCIYADNSVDILGEVSA